QNPPEPFGAADRCADLRPSDMREAPAPDFDKVGGGDPADLLIVDAHKVRWKPRELPVDEDIRRLLRLNSPEALNGQLRRGNHQSVHPAVEELFDFVTLESRIVLGGRQH